MACNGHPTISRGYLGTEAMELRHRTGYDGLFGEHSGPHNEPFASGFYEDAGAWARNLNAYVEQDFEGGGQNITWFGDVGTCAGPPGEAHVYARAFDLTRVTISGGGGNYFDMNVAWRPSRPIGSRRGYIAIAASARRYFPTVLTAWWNAAHENHIHFDNLGVQVPPIRDTSRADTCIVQAACNFLMAPVLPSMDPGITLPRTPSPICATRLG